MNLPLSDRLLARDPRAIARAITLIENEAPEGAALIGRIYPHTGRAYLIGVTGPPGAGKSTLVDRMIAELRKAGSTVGVLAVDPTSPYTGGAILGDRVRMQSHAEDAGVFIRSMATRGHLGGLARTTTEAATVLDAAGFDVVIIETVGVGQDEVDVVRTADISIVVVVPGTGDEVQALKAGIMEIADIFVVNKADRDGADRTAASVEGMLALDHPEAGEWRPPVLRTEATSGTGVPELIAMIERFKAETGPALGARRRARAEWRLREIIGRQFMTHLDTHVLAPGEFDRLLDRVAARDVDPYAAVASVMARAVGHETTSLDHIGVAVQDAGDLVALFERLFGLTTDQPERVVDHRVRFVQTGDTTIELIEPLTPEAPVAKFLAKRGTGLHHICLRVPDVDAAIADLKGRGVRMIDDVPRAGAHRSRIAFIHPSSAQGLLIELKQVLTSHSER
jgi:LAO/AO transport system kinase